MIASKSLTDLREGKVYVSLAADATIDLDAFRKAVKDGGFTLRGIFLRASGTVEKTKMGFDHVSYRKRQKNTHVNSTMFL